MSISSSDQPPPEPPPAQEPRAPRRHKPDVWQPFYFDDYTKATGHLTCVEHGAYLLLLFTAWQNGGPLPVDHERLRVISKMEKKDWKKSKAVILAFFYEKEGEIRHKRVDADLANAEKNIAQRSAAGTASAAAKAEEKRRLLEEEKQRKVNETLTAVATEGPTDPPRSVNPSPSSSPSSTICPNEKNIPPTPKQPRGEKSGGRGVSVESEFDIFYRAYPRKVARDAARRAFVTARRKVSMQTLMDGLERFSWPDNSRFIPHPASWLNAGRWADEAGGDPVLRAAGLDDNGELLVPNDFPEFLQLERTAL